MHQEFLTYYVFKLIMHLIKGGDCSTTTQDIANFYKDV